MRDAWRGGPRAVLCGLLTGLLAAGPAVARAPLDLLPRAVAASTGAPRVVVLTVPLDAGARAHLLRLAYQGEAALASSGRFELVELTEALDSEGAAAREARAQEAEKALAEGQKAYDELDTDKALKLFDAAVRAYEAADLSVHFDGLVRARALKVASQLANGETKVAELEAERLLAMDPRAKFSPNYFPPDFIAFVEKQRKALKAQATSAFEVTTGEVFAQVYVSGQYQGVTPVKVSGLTRADHFVTLLAPGYAVVQGQAREGEARFTLEPVKEAERLRALEARVARDTGGEQRDAAALELARLVQAEQVLVLLARTAVGTESLELTALRLDAQDGHTWGHTQGSVPRGEGLGAATQVLLEKVVGEDTPRNKGKPVFVRARGPGLERKTVGYILLGTGAALLASGVYLGLEASSRANTLQRMAQTDPRSEEVRSSGRTFALMADVGMVLGLASAGVGTWMAFFDKPAGATPAPAPEVSQPPTAAPQPAAQATEPAPKPTEPAPKPAEPKPAPKPAEPAPKPAPKPEKKKPSLDEDDLRNY